jgi:rhodanese-related sulfurtransferase
MEKRLLVIVFVCICMSLVVPSVFAADLKTIDGKALETMMGDGKPLVIVDVRDPDEFSEGHIKGSINIPYDYAVPRIFEELSPKDRIVFVCHGGPMGDELGEMLVEKGYQKVYNLRGGMKRWKGKVTK